MNILSTYNKFIFYDIEKMRHVGSIETTPREEIVIQRIIDMIITGMFYGQESINWSIYYMILIYTSFGLCDRFEPIVPAYRRTSLTDKPLFPNNIIVIYMINNIWFH